MRSTQPVRMVRDGKVIHEETVEGAPPRHIQNVHSRSKHQDVPKTVSLNVSDSDGAEKIIDVPSEKGLPLRG